MIEEKFVRKNEIGVDIEYEKIAIYPKEDKEYLIYTDYVPSNDLYKIRLYADRKLGENKYERLSEKEEKRILEEFYNDTLKEILKLDDELVEELDSEEKTKLERLQDELEEAKKKNNEKELLHIRGQIIKELNYQIKSEKDPAKKEELEELKKKTLEDHKELINKKYKDDYTKKKKTFAGIVTVLPKGIALAFKKVAATIEELKLAKTTKEKTDGILETLKDSVELIGTPVDFSIRFAVNHWYLLLLLLSIKLPIIDNIPFFKNIKNKLGNNIKNMEVVATLEGILEQIKNFVKNMGKVPAVDTVPKEVYEWSAANQKQEQLLMRQLAEAAAATSKVQGTPVVTTGLTEVAQEIASAGMEAAKQVQSTKVPQKVYEWSAASQKQEQLLMKQLEAASEASKVQETASITQGLTEVAEEAVETAAEAAKQVESTKVPKKIYEWSAEKQRQEQSLMRKATETARKSAETAVDLVTKTEAEKLLEKASESIKEVTVEVAEAMQEVSDEFIELLKQSNHFAIGEELKDITVVHSAEEYLKYAKEMNPKMPITLETAVKVYNDYSRGYPIGQRHVIWPEVDEELHYFSTGKDLIQYILDGNSQELTDYFESFNNSELDKISSSTNIQGAIESLAKNLGVSISTATVIFAVAYGAAKIAEASIIGPFALHP
ncbi:MAG: hypothetical protein IJI60_02470 [Bacilli bacterium]|nr:hypothetical protein [Bacilli bacterium]